MIVVDGTDMIMGRMASQISKKLIEGEEVHLVNAENIVLVGNPKQIVERYKQKRRLINKANPEHSPMWSKVPYLLVKRMIRGMLPRKKMKGRDALRKLRVYNGNPKNLEVNFKPEKASFDGISKHITVVELCKNLGYSG